MEELLKELNAIVVEESDASFYNDSKRGRRLLRKALSKCTKEECIEALSGVSNCPDVIVHAHDNFCSGYDCDNSCSEVIYKKLMYWMH